MSDRADPDGVDLSRPDLPEQQQEDWIIHSKAFAARSSEILFLYSTTMQPIFANPAYERIFGRTVEDWLMTGTAGDLAMVHLDDLATVEETVTTMLSAVARAQGDPAALSELSAELTYRIRRPDGERRTVRTRIFPVLADDGRVLGIGGMGTDVTAEKTAIEALVRARDEAREERLRMARFQNRFVQEGLTSHTTWVSLIEGLLTGRTTTSELLALSRQDTYVLTMMDELTRIDDLSIEHQRLAVASCLSDALHAVQRLTERPDAVIETTVTGPDVIVAAGEVMSAILRGMLGFAVMRTPPGGTVVMHIAAEETALTVRVTDDGPEIRGEDLSRLLLPLERLPDDGRPGLRIGLALADAAAALVGGGASVLPRSGSGAIVTCRIPLTSPASMINAPS